MLRVRRQRFLWYTGTMKFSVFVFAVFLCVPSLLAQAATCPAQYQNGGNDYYYWQYDCSSADGTVVRTEYFRKTDTPSNIKKFRDGLLQLEQFFNDSFEQTMETEYQHLDAEKVILRSIAHHLPDRPVTAMLVRSKTRKVGYFPLIYKKWKYYEYEKGRYRVYQVDTYVDGTELPAVSRFFDRETGQFQETAVYDYAPAELAEFRAGNQIRKIQPVAMKVYDADNQLTVNYRQPERLTRAALADIQSHCSSSRTPVLIIDTGIDFSHPRLQNKLFCNQGETLDGRDNDANGLIDDVVGYHVEKGGFPFEELIVEDGRTAASHGSHVTDLAIQGREKTHAALFVAGDMEFRTGKNIQVAQKLISQHGAKFANLSLGFGNEVSPFAPGTHVFNAMRILIQRSADTLFVIAAGNDGTNIDRRGGEQYPASYPFANIIVVGALATDTLNENDYSKYKIADFSSRGERSVDILAPGQQVNAARLGGGMIRFDGTSMATPYLLNNGALALDAVYPQLGIAAIKEIVLKSAYVPEGKPFPVSSGGILFPRRAMAVARLHVEEGMNIEAAALEARSRGVLIPGEVFTSATRKFLRSLWRGRGL